MFGKLRERQTWQPWIRNSSQSQTINSNSPNDPKRKGNYEQEDNRSFVLFVRILSKENHEAYTLRGLGDGIKIYQIKAKLELISGLPAHMVELYSLQNVLLDGSHELKLGNNIKSGETLRLRMNSFWNGLLQSSWRGSLSEVKNFLNIARKRLNSPIAFPNGNTATVKEKEHDALTGAALFVSSRRGNEETCRFLLKNGANTTYVTALGNTCLHCAAHGGYLTLIQLFVSYGANVRFRNVEDESPLATAVNNGHFECARWLWLNQWTLSITKDVLNTAAENKPYNSSFIYSSDIDAKKFPPATTKPRPRSVKETIGRTELRITLNKHKDEQRTISKGENNVYKNEKQQLRPFTADPFPKVKENIQIPKLARSIHSDFSPRTNPVEPTENRNKIIAPAPSNVHVIHPNKSKKIVAFLTSRREVQRSIPSKFHEINQDLSDLHGSSFNLQQRLPSSERKPNTVQIIITKDSTPKSDDVAEAAQNVSLTISSRNSFNTEQDSENLSENVGDNHEESRDISVNKVLSNSNSSELKDVDVANSQSSNGSDRDVPFTTRLSEETIKSSHSITLGLSEKANFALSNESMNECGNNAEFNDNFSTQQCSEGTSSLLSPRKLEPTPVKSRGWKTDGGKEKSSSEILDYTNDSSIRKYVHFLDSNPRMNIPTLSHSTQKNDGKENENKEEQIRKLSFRKEGNVQDISASKHGVSPRASPSSLNKCVSDNVFEKDEEYERNREEKNKKAFEEWLLKKRKSSTRAKENEDNVEKHRRLSSAKFSFSMTFSEWIQMKKELDEKNKETTLAQPSPGKVKPKAHLKYQKTYEDWIREKENEKQREIERRRSNEIERLKKEELESETRKRDYERKMEAWRKKKEEMEKNEAQRVQTIRRMELERARLMYNEWISKPRVKSFNEWMNTKSDDAKLNEVSKAQVAIEEKHTAEMAKMKQQIAKEKFQQWVFKKNLTKLSEERKEFEKSKKKRLKMERELTLTKVNENQASAE